MAESVVNIPVDGTEQNWLAVEVDPGDGVELTAGGQHRWQKPSFNLVSAMDNVMPAVDAIINRVRGGRVAPDEVSLELGLKIGGEHGVILTKGTAEANLKVTVKWMSRPQQAAEVEVEVEEQSSDDSPG